MGIAQQIKKARASSPPLPRLRPKTDRRKGGEVLEMDEMRTFAGRKRRKGWRWLAIGRASPCVVAWTLGSRGPATMRRLWQR